MAEFALRLAAPHMPPHWAVTQLVSRHKFRIPVHIKLANGLRMRVMVGECVSDGIRGSGSYDERTISAMLSHLTPSSKFFDIGAHFGQHTLFASPVCRAVHAFEAVPTTFTVLSNNICMNRLANVTANLCAVTDREGEVTMYESAVTNLGSSSIKVPEETSGKTFTVPGIRLDDYVKERQLIPDLIKIDVEGAEILVLRGAAGLLRETHPTLIVEVNNLTLKRFGFTREDLIRELTSFGYSIKHIEGRPLESLGDLYANVLATPNA